MIKTKFRFSKPKPLFFLFALAFLLWIFLFRPFLADHFVLRDDAVSYSEHIRFFTKNLSKGIFPLWDPIKNCGVSNEFFLRRFCPYNPAWLLLIILRSIGLSFTQSYNFFLVGYFFLGAIGFAKLAKVIFRDDRMAFLAFLLLLFSSIGVRQFDSYFNFVFIPMTWFFYFLLCFTERMERRCFWGLVLTLMVLLATYIPFYFITICLFSLVLLALISVRKIPIVAKKYLQFAFQHKGDVVAALIAICLSVIPTLLFYTSSVRNDFVLPMRHGVSEAVNVLAVYVPNIIRWSVPEELIFSSHYTNTQFMYAAVLYIPIFAYLLLAMGMIARVNKRVVFFLGFGLLTMVMSAPTFSRFYGLLYRHVFYFKYFRNLHFFLWLAIAPILILLAVELFRQLIDLKPVSKSARVWLLFFIFLVHLVFWVYSRSHEWITFSIYPTILASFIFFVAYFLDVFAKRKELMWVIIFIIVTLQPVEQCRHFVENYFNDRGNYIGALRVYDRFYRHDALTRPSESARMTIIKKKEVPLYYAAYWYNFLHEILDTSTLKEYTTYKFILYDKAQRVDSRSIDQDVFKGALISNQNIVFLSPEKEGVAESPSTITQGAGTLLPKAERIEQNTSRFQLVKINVNEARIKMNYNTGKFLVYTDSFSPQWRVAINGRKAELLRANIAFKGVWVPPGENIVHFYYGEPWLHVLNWGVLLLFYIVFGTVIWLHIPKQIMREIKKTRQ